MKLFWRIFIFFQLWRTDSPWMDGEKIDAPFAWELARIFEEHDDALNGWEVLK